MPDQRLPALVNPDLKWDGQQKSTSWDPGDGTPTKPVAIETPTGWTYEYVNREPQANRVPQSLHLDPSGMKIAAGFMAWEAGYEQVLTIPANTRLLVKVIYELDSNPTAVNKPLPQIDGRIAVNGETEASSLWGNLRGETEQLYLFTAPKAGQVTVGFFARAMYGDNVTNLTINSIEILVMEANYGGNLVDTVIPYGQSVPTPTPTPTPTPVPTPLPMSNGRIVLMFADGAAFQEFMAVWSGMIG